MPKYNPKHAAGFQNRVDPPRKKRAANKRALKRGLLAAAVLGIAIPVIIWSALNSGTDVQAGDTVRVRYAFYDAAGIQLEGSEDIVLYVDLAREPRAFYELLTHCRVGVERSFSVPACPEKNCTVYGGFTTGPRAWQGMGGKVTVLEVVSRAAK